MPTALDLHNPLTLLCFANPAAPTTPATVTTHTTAPHVLLQPPQGLEKYGHLCASHGTPVKTTLGATSSVCIHLRHAPTAKCQYHPSDNKSCALGYFPKRSASTAPAGTHSPVRPDPRARNWSFSLHLEPRFFQKSNLGNPNLTGSVTLTQQTAISCIINTFCIFLSEIQARPVGTPPTLSRLPVEESMQLFFKNASDHVLHIPDQFICAYG